MSSILTNNGAIVALQTLKNVNSSLNKAQSEISTGLRVATAKDNSSAFFGHSLLGDVYGLSLRVTTDPETGFVQVQRNLAGDALNRFTEHTSSAVFACPPGVVDETDWWGRALFEPTA